MQWLADPRCATPGWSTRHAASHCIALHGSTHVVAPLTHQPMSTPWIATGARAQPNAALHRRTVALILQHLAARGGHRVPSPCGMPCGVVRCLPLRLRRVKHAALSVVCIRYSNQQRSINSPSRWSSRRRRSTASRPPAPARRMRVYARMQSTAERTTRVRVRASASRPGLGRALHELAPARATQ